MSLPKKLRFEVFRRDGFTCAYCGRSPPEVVLHADHVVPRSDGGPDAAENLITACADCNLGKGARRLDSPPRPMVTQGVVDEARERLEQARAYAALQAELQALVAEQVAEVDALWWETFNGTWSEDSRLMMCETDYPEDVSVRGFLRRIGLASVLEAVRITGERFPGLTGGTPRRYFYGVCHGMARDRGL